ncbi:hypothetical protein C4K40_5352 [Pseudomonas sp. CMR5c]|nr:hypothetical protein C4K40_5352 [Pseudomonas sp. CMR5c]
MGAMYSSSKQRWASPAGNPWPCATGWALQPAPIDLNQGTWQPLGTWLGANHKA